MVRCAVLESDQPRPICGLVQNASTQITFGGKLDKALHPEGIRTASSLILAQARAEC